MMYAEVDIKFVWGMAQNEVPRHLEESEALLGRSVHGG